LELEKNFLLFVIELVSAATNLSSFDGGSTMSTLYNREPLQYVPGEYSDRLVQQMLQCHSRA